MGSITSTIDTAFRDYEVAGDPTSGPNDPVKAQVRAMGPLIEYAIARAGLGALVSDAQATAAELSLVSKDGAVALVYADPDDAQNDLWLKVGDPGEGEWENTGSLHSIMDALGLPYVEGAAEAATEAGLSANQAGLSAEAAAEAQAGASESEANALLHAEAAANAYTGPLTSGVWKRFTGWPRLLLTGVGSVTIDSRDAAGTVSAGIFTQTLTGGDLPPAYPFFGEGAVEVRATLTGTATAEIV